MNERPLFDPDTVTEQQCLACGATRQPGESKTLSCAYDQNGRELDGTYKRPYHCLNAHRPEHEEIPF